MAGNHQVEPSANRKVQDGSWPMALAMIPMGLDLVPGIGSCANGSGGQTKKHLKLGAGASQMAVVVKTVLESHFAW